MPSGAGCSVFSRMLCAAPKGYHFCGANIQGIRQGQGAGAYERQSMPLGWVRRVVRRRSR